MTVAVRTDLTAAEAREQAKAATTPDQARRLLAVALVLEGAGREEAARGTGMDRQTLRSIAARSTGPSLQRGWAGGSGRPQGSRTVAPLDPTPARRAARLPGGGSRSRPRRRGPLAPGRSLRPVSFADIPPGDRPKADGRAALRRPLPRARDGQARPGARLQPDLGTAAAPPIRSQGAGRVQKKLPDLIVAAVGEQAPGKRIEIWFQDEARIGQKGELTRPSGAPARPLRGRRSIGAADAGRGAGPGHGNRAISATRPPISSPPPVPRPRRPPLSCCRRSTPRP